MSKVFDEKENSIEEVTDENVEKVEVSEAEVLVKEEVKEELEVKKPFFETILQFLTKYLGCSNKRADVLISANKPVEIETNKNDDEAAAAAI